MRHIVTAALLLASTALGAAIPTPERPVTDPKALQSPANPNARPVPVEDLALTRSVYDAAWSADGKDVFLTTNLSGRFNIWRVPATGGWPVQLTQSDEVQEGLVVAPDGRTLYFGQDKGGDEYHDIWAVPTAGGAPRNLTNTADLDEDGTRLSPDGKWLAFGEKKKGQSIVNLGLMDVGTGQRRLLTAEADATRRWNPVAWVDGGRALIANRTKIDSSEGEVFRIDVASGKATRLAGGPGILASASGASPDGRTVALTTDEGTKQPHAMLLDTTTGRARALKATPWEQMAGEMTPDGGTMLVRTNADGRSTLTLVDAASGAERPVALAPGYNNTVGASGFSPDGRKLLLGHASAGTPSEVYVVDAAGGEPVQLTRLAMASIDPANMPQSSIVTWKSFDGTLVSGVLVMPANLKRDGSNPAVLLPHGGPTGQAQDSFSRTAAALASRGYITLAPNFRGSTGYGKAFQDANRKDLGGGDLKDVLAGRDFLIATGFVDPKKVGITGGSYGGFMTLMALGKAPDAFATGVQLFGIINWNTMWENSDGSLREYQRLLVGDPAKDAAAYKAQSPLTYLGQARAPLLSLQGENDIRVPRGQAQEVADLLKARGITSETIFYPAEGHGFNKRENQIDSLKRTIDWFDTYLKPAR